jgi:hypothetical protein
VDCIAAVLVQFKRNARRLALFQDLERLILDAVELAVLC